MLDPTSDIPRDVAAELAADAMRLTVTKLVERINRRLRPHGKALYAKHRGPYGAGVFHLYEDGKVIRTLDDSELKQIGLDLGAIRQWERGIEIVRHNGKQITSKLREPAKVTVIQANIPARAADTLLLGTIIDE